MKNFRWEHATAFFERVNRLNLHGLHFQHVVLCQRRAWMHLHRISFAHWDRRVALGTAKHATSHARDHSTEGLFGLAPDRVDWKERVVYEHKGRAGAKEAVSLQTAFYAAMLSIASEKQWDGAIHVLSTRKTRKVPLDEKIIGTTLECFTSIGNAGKNEKSSTRRRNSALRRLFFGRLLRSRLKTKRRRMETLFVPQMAKFRQRNDTISVTLNGRTRSLPINRVAHLVLLAEGTVEY